MHRLATFAGCVALSSCRSAPTADATARPTAVDIRAHATTGSTNAPAGARGALSGYAWNVPDGDAWTRSDWSAISGARLATIEGSIEQSTSCRADEQECLRREGGRICRCITLVTSTGGVIATPTKLAEALGPIDSPAKAADFLALVESDLLVIDGHLAGHVRAIPDGFLVQASWRRTFGCGSHEPVGFVVRVDRKGTMTRVAEQAERPRDPSTTQLCVD